MRAADVMTTDVITVDPNATVQSVATLLPERGISGAPVVDSDGRLVGVISEGDLLHRGEIGTARRHRVRRRSWWSSGRTLALTADKEMPFFGSCAACQRWWPEWKAHQRFGRRGMPLARANAAAAASCSTGSERTGRAMRVV